ncbi:MAG: TIM barrel protein [Dorea sp.]|jgi:sugar phosphate isomerase/epimerase|nr:TIM barrel protein [Dorea sp.]
MRKTKLGISSFCYPFAVGVAGFEPVHRMTAKGLLEEAVRLDVPVVQFGDNLPLDLLMEMELKALSEYAEERELKIEVGTRGLTEENIYRYLKIAHRLNSDLLRVVIDLKEYEPEKEEIIKVIKNVLPALKENNCVLGIENHDRFPSYVYADIMRTIDSSYVGIVLDTVNSFGCEENTRQVMNELAEYTVCFHVKDFKIARIPNAMGFEVTGTKAGDGFLDIPSMMEELKRKSKRDFSTILELWMHPEKEIETTIEKEKLWVEKSIDFLKQYVINTNDQ